MKVVSTDHKQANNLTSLIICFFNEPILFFLSMLRPLQCLIRFYLESSLLYFIKPRYPLLILVSDKRLVFIFRFCNVYTYLYTYMCYTYIYIYILHLYIYIYILHLYISYIYIYIHIYIYIYIYIHVY